MLTPFPLSVLHLAAALRAPVHAPLYARQQIRSCATALPDASVEAAIEAFLSNVDYDDIDDSDWDEMEDEDEQWDSVSDDPDWDRFEQELEDEKSYPEKALAEQAYLGAGEPLQVDESSSSTSALAAAFAADGPGVVRLQRALSAPLAAELRAFALSEMHRARRELDDPTVSATRESRLSNVLASGLGGKRWDVRLPMTAVVRRALSELLGEGAPLGDAFERLGGGPAAELWELSAMISAPGAAAQIIHSDCDGAPQPPLLHTAFVALQPVTRRLGPTRWLPSTHADASAHAAVTAHGDVTVLRGAAASADDHGDGDDEAATRTSPPLSYVGLLDAGDASLYDGRILHCGGANTAEADEDGDGLRVLFYTTFRHAGAGEAQGNPGARSLLARYDGRVTLGMLRDTEGGFAGYFSGGI